MADRESPVKRVRHALSEIARKRRKSWRQTEGHMTFYAPHHTHPTRKEVRHRDRRGSTSDTSLELAVNDILTGEGCFENYSFSGFQHDRLLLAQYWSDTGKNYRVQDITDIPRRILRVQLKGASQERLVAKPYNGKQ